MIIEELFRTLDQQKPFAEYQLHRGEIFSAVEAADGGIGITASPDKPTGISAAEDYLKRIIMQARINARENRMRADFIQTNSIELINLTGVEKIVMAGFIRPVFFQLKEAGIQCDVFDFTKDSVELSPLEMMDDSLSKADLLVTTGTSFSNGSLDRMSSLLKKTARIYIIGPSAPLSPLLFDIIPALQGVFGSIVLSNEILLKINSGAGTRQLHDELLKVVMLRTPTFPDRS